MTKASPHGWTKWAKTIRDNNKLNTEQLSGELGNGKNPKFSVPILRAREESKHLILSNLDIRTGKEIIGNANKRNPNSRRSAIQRYSIYIDENVDTSLLENQIFVMSRTWGITISILALAFNIYILISPYWFVTGDKYHPTNAGLLTICRSHNDSCENIYSHWEEIPNWTRLLIGFIGLSSLIGLSGLIVAILGCIHRPIKKQMYYYHSSGEFSVISFLMIAVGMIIFAVSDRRTLIFNSFGMSFWMCISCGPLYLLAFILLTMDEIYVKTNAYFSKHP